jgi:hypothetical protein
VAYPLSPGKVFRVERVEPWLALQRAFEAEEEWA